MPVGFRCQCARLSGSAQRGGDPNGPGPGARHEDHHHVYYDKKPFLFHCCSHCDSHGHKWRPSGPASGVACVPTASWHCSALTYRLARRDSEPESLTLQQPELPGVHAAVLSSTWPPTRRNLAKSCPKHGKQKKKAGILIDEIRNHMVQVLTVTIAGGGAAAWDPSRHCLSH